MKKKNLFLLAVAALVGLASCTSDVTEGLSDASKRADGPFPVTFEAYTQRGTTRAGAGGELTTAGLKDDATDFGTAGFGVFGYYTNADDYASGATPNFMYNQQVKYDGSAFTYSPVRYWPNEYGQTAQSEDIDKVSFFAYAPYVEVDPKTGYLSNPGTDNEDATWGITGTTRNTYSGDPLVKYIASFESGKSVDLCWGVYNEGSSGWSTMNGKQTTTDGLPWLNVQHAQSVDQKLKFTFRHATAKLTVNVDNKYDDTTTPPVDGATKVYVRSVTFTGMAAQGALNLNNAKPGVPLWMNYSGTGWPESGQSVTVYDGRRDGYEGTSGAEASNETTLGLEATIISDDGNTTAGVTGTPVSLFSGSSVYVIPTGEKVKLTIVYDVETEVDNLPGYLSDGTKHGTSIENRITKELMLDGGTALTFEGGKSYTLNLHLGLNSVKFDATVGDWETGGNIQQPAAILYSETLVGKPLGSGAFTNPLTNTGDGTVSYSSTDESVATVDATTGEVTLVALGTTTIKATVANSEDYYYSTKEVSYELTVAFGPFSVSPTKNVIFAPGNLQATYDGSAWTWKFAEHQYDYIGNNGANTKINGNGTVSENGTVDLFGWVGASSAFTGAAMYGISNSETAADYGNVAGESLKSDWGTLMGSGWYTLSREEWQYLFNTRTASTVGGTENGRYAKATVADKTGFILFPDSYTHPVGVTAPVSVNVSDASFTANSYSAEDWTKMEAAGCVFLPAAGARGGSGVWLAGENGAYWSSSSRYPDYPTCAYHVDFSSVKLRYNYRHNGYSVRLVHPVE